MSCSGLGKRELKVEDDRLKKRLRYSSLFDVVEINQCRTVTICDPTDVSNKAARVVYTRSGKGILVLGSRGSLTLWTWADNPSGKVMVDATPLQCLLMSDDDNHETAARPSIALSDIDRWILCSVGGKIALIDQTTSLVKTRFMPPSPASCLEFHPRDSKFIVVGMKDSSICIVDLRGKKKVVSKLEGHDSKITGLAFSRKRNMMVSSDANAQICIWQVSSWQLVKSFGLFNFAGLGLGGDTSVQFRPDEQYFLVVHSYLLSVFSVPTMKRHAWSQRNTSAFSAARISCAVYSCNSELIIAAFADGFIRIFEADSLRLRCQVSPHAYMSETIVNRSKQVYPVAVAAHPHYPNQFTIRLTNGDLKVIEPIEDMWGVSSSADMALLWFQNSREWTDEDYTKLYHALWMDSGDEEPLSWINSSGDDASFKIALFVPPNADHKSISSALKLYVKGASVSATCYNLDGFLPEYLHFLKGVVCTDTCPLTSQDMMNTLKKKVISMAIDMICELAKDDPDKDRNGMICRSIKLGIIDDVANRNRLTSLVRFATTMSGCKSTSMEQYKSRMKSGQKYIFYITGPSKEQLAKSTFLERFTKRNYEVLYFTDSVDEVLMEYLMDNEDKKFQNVCEGLAVGNALKFETVESFEELTKWWKGILDSGEVDDVKISNRLVNSPCVVVGSKYAWSWHQIPSCKHGRGVLEINPRHPIIMELKDRVESDPQDEGLKQAARLVYQTAVVENSFILNNPKEYASQIYSLVKTGFGISPDAMVQEDDDMADF